MKRAGLVLPLLLLAACAENLLPPVWDLQETRVIGARVEPDGDATRARLAPGESGRVRFVVADPGAQRELTWALVACVAGGSSLGFPACRDAASAFYPTPGLQLTPTTDRPDVAIAMPSDATLAGANELLIFGAVCPDSIVDVERIMDVLSGEANPPSTLSPCSDPNEPGEVFFLTMPVERSDPPNHHPSFAEVRFRGSLWDSVAPADALRDGCPPGLPQVIAGDPAAPIALTATDGSREPYTVIQGDPPEPLDVVEDLQITLLTTAGELDQSFTFLDADHPIREIDWIPPAPNDVPAFGRLVRFHFVMRDGRGGIDFAERALCVTR